MSAYVLKSVGATVGLEVDWLRGDLVEGERVARDLGWSIQPVDADGPRVDSQSITPTRSRATISGGRPGQFHLVWCRARTDRERVLCRAIVLRIASGNDSN
jgi:hypothetical protein